MCLDLFKGVWVKVRTCHSHLRQRVDTVPNVFFVEFSFGVFGVKMKAMFL